MGIGDCGHFLAIRLFFLASVMGSHYFGTTYVKYSPGDGGIENCGSAKIDFGYCQNHPITGGVSNIWQPVYIFAERSGSVCRSGDRRADSSRLTRVAGFCH